ncbi:MAG TPA: extracellular solute-binding protein [Aggregatilinea sp.]|jgi:raffinose/stachyose/melibiose transport system substrate-binding protein|uniref:extracellular solute-binding protein n=1 Tax=Aggregatilinea sp. TaxID=2806333 RepID=UPI002C81C75F|nr:extracellular solute-binding protein [Aggregatilinea sp.]HML23429.1 extracellular solute-binding protein [Aggregatilinea sp.]
MRKALILVLVVAMLIGGGVVSARQEKSITFWHIQNTGDGPMLIQQAVDRYMADNPDVNVEVVPMQNDPYKTRIRTAMGAGDAPCIFLSWGGGPLYEYVKADQVLDLTDYMNADDYKDHFVPASLSNVTFDGKIYGVPVENTSVAVIFYNKAIFADLGLEPPTTWDELLAVSQTLIDNGISPFSLANKTKWTSSMYYMYLVDRIAGPEVFASAANRTGGSFEDPAFVQAGQMIQDLVEMGAFNEGFNGLDYDTGQGRMLIYAGQAAMELMGSWEIGNFLSENPDFYAEDLGIIPFPAVEGGAGDPTDVVGTVGDNYYSISPTCEYPDEAFALLQYVIDDESVAARIESGRVPPVKGVSEMIEEPMLKQIVEIVENAASVQLWYDQYLPPELGEVHKDTMQALFGLEITPEEAAQQQEAAVAEYFGE